MSLSNTYPKLGFAALLLALALTACTTTPDQPAAPQLRFSPVGWPALPGWEADDLTGAMRTLSHTCSVYQKRPAARQLHTTNPRFGTYSDWHRLCAELDDLPAGLLRSWLEANFIPARVVATGPGGTATKGLFTGYYTPVMDGSRTRDVTHTTPIHAKPADIVTASLGAFDPALSGHTLIGRVENGRFVPYHKRAAVRRHGAAQPLLWLADPIDAFFLHIQGSGLVRLPDGEVIGVGFAGHNGHSYHAIGRTLINMGALAPDNVTMHSIRAWLAANPDQREAVFNTNPRYIFFTETDGQTRGSLNVPLTPGRSLAVDPTHIPAGLPVYVATTLTAQGSQPWQRFMVAQDTGAAITGAVRGDIYFGEGAAAGRLAGVQNAPGDLFVLLPKSK